MVVRLGIRQAPRGVVLSVHGLDSVDPCDHGSLVAAFGAHLGLDAQALRKAAGHAHNEPLDPRFPQLGKLLRLARKDWDTWGDRLVEEVIAKVRSGDLIPLEEGGEVALRELFRDHELSIVARFSGRGLSAADKKRLVGAGLLPPSELSFVELAWRLGRQVSSLQGPPGLPTAAEARQSIAATVKAMTKRPLAAKEREAVSYVQRRGAVYMRRPAATTTGSLSRALLAEEERVLRGAVAKSIEGREGWRAAAKRLRVATTGHPSLLNDYKRVAKTELHLAHAEGALFTLKEESADLGISDPEVYKMVDARACVDCRRIWGPMASPRRYKLSQVESRNDGRANFGLPRSAWGPTVGPIHPNCTEGPLHRWDPKMHALVEKLAAQMRDRHGSL